MKQRARQRFSSRNVVVVVVADNSFIRAMGRLKKSALV